MVCAVMAARRAARRPRQINRWNNQPGSRHAILDQRFDRSENSDLSFAELHAAASQQPCSASQPLQGCRQCEPWTGGAGPIDPATAWPNGLLRQRPGYLRLLPHPVSRPGSSQIDRTGAPRKYTFLYKCTSGFSSVLSACGAQTAARIA